MPYLPPPPGAFLVSGFAGGLLALTPALSPRRGRIIARWFETTKCYFWFNVSICILILEMKLAWNCL